MKLFSVLTAAAVSVLISAPAFAQSVDLGSMPGFFNSPNTSQHFSAGVGGSLSFGGNTGKWATGAADASGIANLASKGGDSFLLNKSTTGTVSGYSTGSIGPNSPADGLVDGHGRPDCNCVSVSTLRGKGGVSTATNKVVAKNLYGEIQSSAVAHNASGVGEGLGGAIIVGGGLNTSSHSHGLPN